MPSCTWQSGAWGARCESRGTARSINSSGLPGRACSVRPTCSRGRIQSGALVDEGDHGLWLDGAILQRVDDLVLRDEQRRLERFGGELPHERPSLRVGGRDVRRSALLQARDALGEPAGLAEGVTVPSRVARVRHRVRARGGDVLEERLVVARRLTLERVEQRRGVLLLLLPHPGHDFGLGETVAVAEAGIGHAQHRLKTEAEPADLRSSLHRDMGAENGGHTVLVDRASLVGAVQRAVG